MMQLKRTHWFFGTLLMMVMVLCRTMTAYAAEGTGIIDTVDSQNVRGWAWSNSDPAASVDVRVVVTNQSSGQTVSEYTALANSYRSDLAYRGTGNYGFQINVPWDTYEDGTYRVDVYAGSQKLNGSRIYNTNEGTATSAAASAASVTAGNVRSLGVFKTTGYCPCYGCSEGWGRRTSTGAIAASNHTIAVDPRVIPYGSKVMINGVVYTAEDRGGGVKGNHIDIFFDTHGETRSWGKRNVEVFLVQ